MSRLTRDGTAKPVSRDQILRRVRGQGNIYFPCSADHKQDWQPYPVDPYSASLYVMTIQTYTYCSLYNVRRTAVTFSVQIRCCPRPFTQYCLHGTLRPSSCIRVVVHFQNDRRPRAAMSLPAAVLAMCCGRQHYLKHIVDYWTIIH